MIDAPTPKKAHRPNHRSLGVGHTNAVPDRDVTPMSKVSDAEIATRIEMQLIGKPIPSDAAHTTSPAHPIPFPPAKPFFPSHPLKI
jgi:hypothetical protein